MFIRRLSAFSIIAAACLVFMAGCGGKEAVKPSEEAAKASRALGRLQDIRQAYVARDFEGVTGGATKDFLGGYSRFVGSVRKDMETYDKVEFELKVERIEETGDEVRVAAFWHGSWWDAKGNASEGRGNSVFIFRDSAGMPLAGILGDSPFGVVR